MDRHRIAALALALSLGAAISSSADGATVSPDLRSSARDKNLIVRVQANPNDKAAVEKKKQAEAAQQRQQQPAAEAARQRQKQQAAEAARQRQQQQAAAAARQKAAADAVRQKATADAARQKAAADAARQQQQAAEVARQKAAADAARQQQQAAEVARQKAAADAARQKATADAARQKAAADAARQQQEQQAKAAADRAKADADRAAAAKLATDKAAADKLAADKAKADADRAAAAKLATDKAAADKLAADRAKADADRAAAAKLATDKATAAKLAADKAKADADRAAAAKLATDKAAADKLAADKAKADADRAAAAKLATDKAAADKLAADKAKADADRAAAAKLATDKAAADKLAADKAKADADRAAAAKLATDKAAADKLAADKAKADADRAAAAKLATDKVAADKLAADKAKADADRAAAAKLATDKAAADKLAADKAKADAGCPPGQQKDGAGRCYAYAPPATQPVNIPDCLPGYATTLYGKPCRQVEMVCPQGQRKNAYGECKAIVAVPTCPNGQGYNRRTKNCDYLPGHGPTKPVLVDNGPPVKIHRDGERPPSYGGDAWKLIGIVALPIAIGIITSGNTKGGPKKYVDGYLDLPPEPKRCRGETPDGCELRVVDVPRQDGGIARACVRYCPRPDEIDDEPLPPSSYQPPVVHQTPNANPPLGPLPNVGTPPHSTPISSTWIEPPAKGTRPHLTPISSTWIEPPARGTRPHSTPISSTWIEPLPKGTRPHTTPVASTSTEPPVKSVRPPKPAAGGSCSAEFEMSPSGFCWPACGPSLKRDVGGNCQVQPPEMSPPLVAVPPPAVVTPPPAPVVATPARRPLIEGRPPQKMGSCRIQCESAVLKAWQPVRQSWPAVPSDMHDKLVDSLLSVATFDQLATFSQCRNNCLTNHPDDEEKSEDNDPKVVPWWTEELADKRIVQACGTMEPKPLIRLPTGGWRLDATNRTSANSWPGLGIVPTTNAWYSGCQAQIQKCEQETYDEEMNARARNVSLPRKEVKYGAKPVIESDAVWAQRLDEAVKQNPGIARTNLEKAFKTQRDLLEGRIEFEFQPVLDAGQQMRPVVRQSTSAQELPVCRQAIDDRRGASRRRGSQGRRSQKTAAEDRHRGRDGAFDLSLGARRAGDADTSARSIARRRLLLQESRAGLPQGLRRMRCGLRRFRMRRAASRRVTKSSVRSAWWQTSSPLAWRMS